MQILLLTLNFLPQVYQFSSTKTKPIMPTGTGITSTLQINMPNANNQTIVISTKGSRKVNPLNANVALI